MPKRGMAKSIIYKCRKIDFCGKRRNILYPKSGHSRTALLAFVNCLLLKGELTITAEANNDYPLQSVILRLGRMYRRHHSRIGGDDVITKDGMEKSVNFLSDLFDVDIDFTRNDGIQSSTGRLDMFEHLKVQLLHACIVESNDTVGTGYHPVFKVEHSLPRNSDPLVQKLLDAGVTAFGIKELQNTTEEGEIFVLFRKGSFHTLIKQNGTLYVLNNVTGALDKDMWKELNERDDGKFYNSNFELEPMGENRSEHVQQAQAEVPSQTEPSVPERIKKCLRSNCQADFQSEVNLNRHKQVHAKNQVKKASFNKAEFSKHWDELSLEEAAKVISIKGMKIQGISGDILLQVIKNVDNADEFYDRANRMKVLLNGTKKIPSDELFTILDEDSENTAFSIDIHSSYEKNVFSLQVLLLSDFNNVFACCCYFIEKNLVSSWLVCKTAEATSHAKALLQESDNSLPCGISGCTMQFNSKINFNRHKLSHVETDTMDFMENFDAISKYWDDLTCEQTRQIMSLTATKITNLQRRLKNFEEDHPLATTGKQLIDIVKSPEKMSSTKMLGVLEKASENSFFCNDIRCCKDDEIFAVEGNKCTPGNDVALMSYIIERKLVEGWSHSKESVTGDTQGLLVPDKTEQSEIKEPGSMKGDKLPEKRDSTECEEDQVDVVPKSQLVHDKQSKLSETAEPDSMGAEDHPEQRDSTDSKAAQVGDVPTSQHILNPTSGILLEEFVRTNKLTKIYKIRPKDVFKVLKRSLKTLKKEFNSKVPKKKLKAAFKLSSVILTRRGRKCARGFLLCIVKNHREGKSWNGSFQLSDMQVVNGQFIISKAADAELSLDCASADFKRLWELLLVPFYKNTELGSYPLYFEEFGHDILNLPDPATDPDGFMKYEKYLALHFAFMPPLSRLTLLISLYKVYDSNRLVPDYAYQPLNQSMSYDWRDDIKSLPILTNVYYFSVNGRLFPYTCSYFHLLKFSRHFGSHDFDYTEVQPSSLFCHVNEIFGLFNRFWMVTIYLYLKPQMVPDMMVTDLVIGQLLAPSLAELVLFIVNHTNMEGRYFRSFQQYESSDDDAFFCVEDDDDDYSADSDSSDASDMSA